MTAALAVVLVLLAAGLLIRWPNKPSALVSNEPSGSREEASDGSSTQGV